MARKTVEQNISYDDVRRRYYVYLDYGLDATGHRARHYETCPSLTTARRILRAFHVQQDSHLLVPPQEITLKQWLDYWMGEIILPYRAATTVYGYRNMVTNHLTPALGRIQLQKLTPRHVQDYYAMLHREKHLSPNTIRRHHDLLSAALRLAVRQDVLFRSPMDRVEPPKTVAFEAHFYGLEELRTLYARVTGTWLELTVKLAGNLGLRREELCALRWACIDFELRRIHIRAARTAAGGTIVEKETKNFSSNRVLYLTDDMALLLRRERARQAERKLAMGGAYPDTGLVLVDDGGKPYHPNAISCGFSRFIARNQLPKITLHGLRHTFATLASAQGAPLFDIGKALGHSTPAITGRIYTHLTDQVHTETVLRVAAALSSG